MFHRFRSMPATAMAAVLGCALMATAATPAVAREKQKKEDTAQGPKLSPSKGFMPTAQKMDETLKKKDAAGLQAAVTEGQSAATSNDDKYFLGFYTLQLGVLTKDQALQAQGRSEEHTSELQSLMRISYAVFCLKKKNKPYINKAKTRRRKI